MYKYMLSAFVSSNVGNVRGNNEDNFNLCGAYRDDVSVSNVNKAYQGIDKRALFSVCDGMGGESFGELASLCAVQNMRTARRAKIKSIAGEDVLRLNKLVCDKTIENKASRMGSTLANLYIDNGIALSCNLGDSRVYLLRDGALTQLSRDHDEATSLVNMGILTPEEARTDKRRHHLTQFLGMTEDEVIPEPHYSDEIALSDGDCFLLCSDGVTDMLTDDELLSIMSKNPIPGDAANEIIKAALSNGGKDNATAMVVKVKKLPVLLYNIC